MDVVVAVVVVAAVDVMVAFVDVVGCGSAADDVGSRLHHVVLGYYCDAGGWN